MPHKSDVVVISSTCLQLLYIYKHIISTTNCDFMSRSCDFVAEIYKRLKFFCIKFFGLRKNNF